MNKTLSVVAWLILSFNLHAQQPKPDFVLESEVRGIQNKTYFEVPFEVPAGIHRISVDFSYTGKAQKTTLDIGIADPQRFRGNSGGNKSHFTLSESDATPSYLPGAIPSGRWRLLISVPNIRASERSTYRAEIRFNNRSEDQSFTLLPLETGTRWYRGDLHMHTSNSDGSCTSQTGKRVPCPVYLTEQAAVQRGLDFIAITDHNTSSQYNEMRELQPYFDRLLSIPGREITTFWGHFNIYGVTQFIDYRVQADNIRAVNAVLGDANSLGGIASINHADSPGGEVCMGCAWEPRSAVDPSLLTSVEVVNSDRLISTDFWDRLLEKGARLTAIGGSDNHDALAPAESPGSIGMPTTVVNAHELSVPGILDGIRKGRVFIDLTGSRDKILDIQARGTNATSPQSAQMGGALHAPAGDSVAFQFRVLACAGATAHVIIDGKQSATTPLTVASVDETLPFDWKSDGQYHWIRVEVRDASGRLTLISNPIYVNPQAP